MAFVNRTRGRKVFVHSLTILSPFKSDHESVNNSPSNHSHRQEGRERGKKKGWKKVNSNRAQFARTEQTAGWLIYIENGVHLESTWAFN